MEIYNWQQPQRQSAAAIFILLLKSAASIAKAFWPALIVMLFREQKDDVSYKLFIVVIVFVALTLIHTFIRYWFFTFFIDSDNLVIKTGWLKKKTLTLSRQHIQAVHIEQSLWQQVLQVAKISFDSSGSEKVEAKIDALSMRKASALKLFLLKPDVATQVSDVKQIDTPIIKLSYTDLAKLSLSANHLETFFILLALGFNVMDDIKKAFNFDGWRMMEKYSVQLGQQTLLVISLLLIFISIISVSVSVFRTMLKFYGYTLYNLENSWKISFGLFNRQEKILPLAKIQLVIWRANWIRRKLGFYIFEVQHTGAANAHRKDWIRIPVTRRGYLQLLAKGYQHSPILAVGDGETIDAAYWKRKFLLTALPVTILLIAVMWYWWSFYALWLLVMLIYFAAYFYQLHKNFRWQVNGEGLQIYTGCWGRKHTLLTWQKVQQVQLIESYYQRRRQLASLQLFTSAQNITLPFIPINIARGLADRILFTLENKEVRVAIHQTVASDDPYASR